MKMSSWLLVVVALLVFLGCERDDSTVSPASFPVLSDVFLDGFASGLDFQAFLNSKLDALSIDEVDTYSGTASMRFTVPDGSNPNANFAGGAFVAQVGRDLSSFDALTFYAKTSIPASIGVAGFGNDNTGTSMYTVERLNFDVTTSWSKYAIPIPDPEVLGTEKGLFHIAAGAVNGQAYTLWVDEVQFESLGTIIDPEPVLSSQSYTVGVGDMVSVGNLDVVFDDLGSPLTVNAMPSYFDFISSDESVAMVSSDGTITAVGMGAAEITVELKGVAADGSINLTVGEATDAPLVPATAPDLPAEDVISLFSNEYDDVSVETWSADWDMADVEDVVIASDDIKYYSNLVFAGIEFGSSPIDASGMTHFYFDMWTPNAIEAGTEFKVKLVDFGPDGVYDGGDDVEHELTFSSASTPALSGQTWIRFEIPLTSFTGLTTTGALAQLIFSGSLTDIYLDNILFHSGEADDPSEPGDPSPTPTYPAGNTISLFCDEYDDVPVDTWSAPWPDEADVEDTDIDGNAVKLYTNTIFAGIEFTSPAVDASAMTHFRMDIWTSESTDPPAEFKIKLVDFGPNGVWDGGGDDTEHELTFNSSTSPALQSGQWVTFDLPLNDFVGMTNRTAVAQLIFVSDPGPNTIYVDNVLFHN